MNKANFHPLVYTTLLALALAIQPVRADNGVPLDQIAAIVNSDAVMLSEARQRAAVLRASSQAAASLSPQALLKLAVDNLIMERLQMQKAETAGIQIDDVTLNKAIETIAQQNKLSMPAFQQALQKEGINYAEFREQTRRKLMADALRKRELRNRVKAAEGENEALIEQQYQSWLLELRNDAYIEYRIPVETNNSLRLR
ncbi:SurA N-terminal domain-containing protein [Candidatus Thiothrix sp. Deng01]|uniref:SurA N-terminal domain-containing protein n=1 Tax=Candidatus Thiothrix phosphatis TaxID=3112415 RepID=A0ABU6D1K4_9GAMM|nr:SurA N-terminal domain-containing protein [Candidatus Thiothrix sp. Deng01]MEB4592948.1 SurA N-terminal domain-containing protein [Candidatus Thiothrix sp. Deng01]